MQEKNTGYQNRAEAPEWFRIGGIIVACGLTIGGILIIPWLFAVSRSWSIGLLLIVMVIPLVLAMQTILLGKAPANVFLFLKIYVAEFTSLFLQLGFLLVTLPFIAVLVAGRLASALLLAVVISWFIVGLQQLGFDIGRKMPGADILILLWVTIGLTVAVGIFFLLVRLFERHEDGYFSLWARQFTKIREFFRYDTPGEG
jgi:hypothetical protein